MLDANREDYDPTLDGGRASVDHVLNIFEDALEHYTTEQASEEEFALHLRSDLEEIYRIEKMLAKQI